METSETTQNSAIKSEMDTRDDRNQDIDNSMTSELFVHVDAAMGLDSDVTGKSPLEMDETPTQQLGTLLPPPKTGKKQKKGKKDVKKDTIKPKKKGTSKDKKKGRNTSKKDRNTSKKADTKKTKKKEKDVIKTNYYLMYRDIKEFVKSLNAAPLWKVVDNGVVNVVTSDAVAIHISLNYFGYFGQFKD
eukprot:29508_1